MKVKFISTMAGPSGSALPGQVQDVDNQLGEDLIAGGYAEPAEPARTNEEDEPDKPEKPVEVGEEDELESNNPAGVRTDQPAGSKAPSKSGRKR